MIVAPKGEEVAFNALGLTQERLIYEDEPIRDGYTWQQVVKLHADEYTDADYILFVDSDCVFFTKVTPEYFFTDSKPYLLCTPYSLLGNTVPWKPGTDFVVGRDTPYEFMRRHPMMYHRDTLKAFRDYILATFGKTCREFMLENCSKRRLSEFNILGAFTYFHRPTDFHWIDTDCNLYPPDCLKQFWSYEGVDGVKNAKELAKLKPLL